MPTIKDILNAKGRDVHSISPDSKVFDALKLMADKGIGALVVLTEGKIVGVISERDYARKVILMGKLSKDTPVQDIMTSEIICISPDQVPEACLALMTDKHVRHMPVLENDQLVGIVSIGDLVKSIISDQKLRIDQLEHYVRGTL
jgi:CBS domain-containing protein